MSARAMRKIKGDDEAAVLLLGRKSAEDDESDDEDEDLGPRNKSNAKKSAFAHFSSDSDDSSEDENNDVVQVEELKEESSTPELPPAPRPFPTEKEEDHKKETPNPETSDGLKIPSSTEKDDGVEHEEDLDAILNEFKEKDEKHAQHQEPFPQGQNSASLSFRVILKDFAVRDLDIDWSMRNALSSEGGVGSAGTAKFRRNVKTFFFGQPPTNGFKQLRPPNFVGGGIGMATYEDFPLTGNKNNNNYTIPWPYSEITTSPSDWYRFIHADSYCRDLEDYRYIQQTGDLNNLLLFVAHHPFVTDALLQLATVLCQVNQSQQGQTFLRRCLFVYESACLIRFHQNMMILKQNCFMDHEVPENRVFFDALLQLLRMGSIAALWRTCLAVSRYIVALDPLRDPLNVLAVMDSYAMCCRSEVVDRWLIELVESNVVPIVTCNNPQVAPEAREECRLRSMPNWRFSYALALFRVYGGENEKTKTAIQEAISEFPSVVGLLVQTAEVDTTGRSMRRDWGTVLGKASERDSRLRNIHFSGDAISATEILQVVDNLIGIFVKLSAKLWCDHDVLQFLYDNLLVVVNNSDSDQAQPLLQPALLRYARVRASDWETRTAQQLPEAENIVEPELVAQAMMIEPNRPRLLRRVQVAPRMEEIVLDDHHEQQPRVRQPMVGGPPTGVIDPDLPLMEIFWRSLLPWNRVEGVRRDPG